MMMKTSLLMTGLLTALLTALPAAHAERADSLKKTEMKSEDASSDLVSKVTHLTGNVEIRRGTLLIKADKAVVTEDPQGYKRIVLTSNKGSKPVFFRQKRDGGADQWLEGEAARVEYDDKTEVVDLLVEAKARRTTDGAVTDEVSGEHISYKANEERYFVTQLPGGATTGDRRGTMVLQPVRKGLPSSAASATASATVP